MQTAEKVYNFWEWYDAHELLDAVGRHPDVGHWPDRNLLWLMDSLSTKKITVPTPAKGKDWIILELVGICDDGEEVTVKRKIERTNLTWHERVWLADRIREVYPPFAGNHGSKARLVAENMGVPFKR